MSKSKSKKSKAKKEIEVQNEDSNVVVAEVETAGQSEADVEADSENSEEALVFSEDEDDTAILDLQAEEAEIDVPETATSEPVFPEASEELLADTLNEEVSDEVASELNESELGDFESADIVETEFVEEERLDSIIEAMLFASDRAISMATFKMTFKGTNVRTEHIRRALDRIAIEYAGGRRGVSLDEVPGGFQIRTKLDNMKFLTRTLKVRPFKLSGPALEVLAILAYKQPVIKSEIDDIRGVESGHLLRALMEKGLAQFEGKSDFPGRPMLYATTKKFLEIFGLRNLKELPTLSQIDELLPEGIGDENDVEKEKLSDLTDKLSETVVGTYSEGEEELTRITDQISEIATSSDFFEKEKVKQRESRDTEKARNLREAMIMGEEINTRDRNWLTRYDEALAAGTTLVEIADREKAAKLAALNEKSSETPVQATESSEEGSDLEANEVDPEAAALEAELSLAEARFEEEEDISLDGDLNVPYHDEDEPSDASV